MTALPEAFAGRRCLITGGLGFIGSNLARRLVDLGSEVLIVDSMIPEYGGNLFNIDGAQDRLRINFSDVRDRHGMEYLVRDQDFIFSLAGQVSHLDSMEDPLTDLEINCSSQLSLIAACRRHNPGVKVVYAGTRQAYGRPKYLPVDESHPCEPTDFNGINKMAGEWYYMVCHRVYGLRTASLRMTNVYGPRMRVRDARQTFIGWWIRSVVEGRELEVFGDGSQIRDFNHVDDAVEALLLAAASPAADGEIYNLGGDEPIRLLDLAKLMVEINGSGSYRLAPFPPDRELIDIGDYYGNYGKIQGALGWRPAIPLREGLRQTLEFYRRNRSHYW
ncbi:MAG: NAD-dependent epimerase/dehydratase family protein [Acidobacteria bacterium]|nr:NAD-dependent epimerase/dehydratase family protein [Acidobacteriota bacterium]